MQTARDVPLFIRSEVTSSERRITPSWSIAQLKTKLEPITGIPSSSQKLTLKLPGREPASIEASDEDSTHLDRWHLQAYAEIEVLDTRPSSARGPGFNDLSAVPKYQMPEETYQELPDSALAWKKSQKLGRFDPNAPAIEEQKAKAIWQEVTKRDIEVSKRCQLGEDSARRGTVAFVGEVPEIKGAVGPWVGVMLDEPMGKNDGSIGGTRYFECPAKRGVFVRPDRVQIGEFKPLTDEELDSDMEEM